MAERNHNLRVVSSDDPPPLPTVLEEFDKALYSLSGAISVVKTIEAADSSLDWAIRDQAMVVATEKLDDAYDRLDKALLRLGREGSQTREAQS